MPIEGPLKELGIHDVFQLLDLGRKSGVLRVTSDLRQNSGEVVFDSGAVIGARIQSNPHPLGEVLLRSGKISEADLAHARMLQRSGDPRRLGDLLVDSGAIGRRELERQARVQIEEVVFALMGWSEGYFSFEDGAAPPWADAAARIPTEALLMEAARRIDEWSRIEAKVPHLGVVPRLDGGGNEGQLQLIPLEWEVLAAIDGARDLRDIADGLGRPEFEVARAAYGLAVTGVIVLENPQTIPFQGGSPRELDDLLEDAEEHLALGDADSAQRLAEELAMAHPDAAGPQVILGRALVRQRLYEDAEQAFAAALRLDPLCMPARRLIGLTQAMLGRLGDAVENWERWLRSTDRPPAEEEWVSETIGLRDAALTLLEAIGRHA